MNRYNELQILYTKEKIKKVPEAFIGLWHQLDFPTLLVYHSTT